MILMSSILYLCYQRIIVNLVVSVYPIIIGLLFLGLLDPADKSLYFIDTSVVLRQHSILKPR
jgi:hypothetical protein